MKPAAKYGDTELKRGERILINTRSGTRGSGEILGFRPAVAGGQVNICVQMDEKTKFSAGDRWPFRTATYDRIADIGITFDEIVEVESKSKRRRTAEMVEVVTEKIVKPKRSKPKKVDIKDLAESDHPAVKANRESWDKVTKPKKAKAKVNGSAKKEKKAKSPDVQPSDIAAPASAPVEVEASSVEAA
jgi:hypothetical protein